MLLKLSSENCQKRYAVTFELKRFHINLNTVENSALYNHKILFDLNNITNKKG